jgi:phosphotransferase system enzyme I (PtsI)
MRRLRGTGVVGGIAVGQAVVRVRRGRAVRVPIPEARVAEEVARLDRACDLSRRQLSAIKTRLRVGPGAELTALFDAQLLMLDDALLSGRARAIVTGERVNAEWAVQQAFEEVAALFDDIDDPYLRDRRGDVADVAGRIRLNLREGEGGWQGELARGEGPVVIVADDLPVSEAAQVDWSRVTGLAIDAGSRTSHTAILARSLAIPTVVGLGAAARQIVPGTTVVVDGTAGELLADPPPDVARAYEARVGGGRGDLADDASSPGPATTRDGVRIRLYANVDRLGDVDAARRAGADGVGLLRSEVLLVGGSLPGLTGPESELAQAAVYRQVAVAMAPRPVSIRTFDLDESQLGGAGEPGDDRHRVLGLRGVRLGLAEPGLLETQLRAILRAAAAAGNVQVLVPFVTTASEIVQVRERLALARRSLAAEGVAAPEVALGAMIEVPAAALAADHLAEAADFLAVGTNDLVQYLLAADRTDERVAPLVAPVHPSLIRLLRILPRLAGRHRTGLSVCGEMGSQPAMLALLIGLGVREFSMTPAALPAARRVIEASDVRALTRLARQAARTGLMDELEHYAEQALASAAVAPGSTAR